MYLSQIKIHSVRNLKETTLSLSPHINVFYGQNGSGKTSLLECIYLLATGKSFRTHHAADMIQFLSESFVISGTLSSQLKEKVDEEDKETTRLSLPHWVRLGVERKRTGNLRIHVNDQVCHSIGELAKHLPVQILNTDSYYLLEASPEDRRRFLDWGVFHVEHSFFHTWQRYKRALQQRNAALKQVKERGVGAVLIWDPELIEMGEKLTSMRNTYLQAWEVAFKEILGHLLKVNAVELRFRAGWEDEDKSLKEALEGALFKDKLIGYSTVGPHRADFSFWIDGVPAKSVLSRGQLKLFISALFLAHSQMLYIHSGSRGLFLMDDLTSELDSRASRRFLETLDALEGEGQVIMTSIEKDSVEDFLLSSKMKMKGREEGMFHVEHGVILKKEGLCTI